MKKIIIIFLSLMTLNVFAAEGEGYEILWSRETLSPGAEGHIQHGMREIDRASVGVAKALDTTGHANQSVGLKSLHQYQIYNTTNSTQRYKVHYSLDSLGVSNAFDAEIEIKPKGWMVDASYIFLTVSSPNQGAYPINANTDIQGESVWHGHDGKTLKIK